MLPFFSKIEELSKTRVSGLGLSIFRIFFSLVLIFEVIKLFRYRHLIFDPVADLVEGEVSFSIILIFWLFVLGFLLIGFKTRTAALINYLLVLVTFSSFTTAKYHFDATLTGLSFLFLFLPVSNRLSLDHLVNKLETLRETEIPVRKIYYYLPVLLIPGLQYLDSVFHKTGSEMWLAGLGIWLPASLPNQIYSAQTALLNMKGLVVGLSYFVIAFEALFLPLVFYRKTRFWACLIGIGMHAGIALIFPVPEFGILFIGIYLLLIPVSFWNKFSSITKENENASDLPVSAQNLVPSRLEIFINHFKISRNNSDQPAFPFKDNSKNSNSGIALSANPEQKTVVKRLEKVWLLAPISVLIRNFRIYQGFIALLSLIKVKPIENINSERKYSVEKLKTALLYGFVIYLIFSQFLKTLNSPLINNISTHTGLNEVKHYVSKVFFPVSVLNKKFLGITEGLIYTNFNEGDFYMTTLVYEAPDGKKTWLPLLDEQGMVSPTATGRLFTKWNRVNFSYPAEMDKFERGLVQFSAFWAAQHNISLQQAEFRILQKKMVIEFEWKKDFLEDHLKAPWQEIGTLRWKNNKPELYLQK